MSQTVTLRVREAVSIGERVRLARIAAGLDQGELAAALGMSTRTLQRSEAGERRFTRAELVVAAQFTSQDPAFFGASSRPAEAPIVPPLPADVNGQEER